MAGDQLFHHDLSRNRIRLDSSENGSQDAGYIYFDKDPPVDGDFGGSDDQPYVIMHQPIANWPLILDILRHEKPLYIRGTQSADDQPVSTFFGTATDEPVGEGENQS